MPDPSLKSSSSSVGSRQGNTPPPFYVRTNRISCDPCRKRKLKCDRVKPCSTCSRRGIEDQCYQEDHPVGRNEAASGASPGKRPRLASGMPANEPSRLESPVNQSESSSLATSLENCKGQLDAISEIAKQSTQSLDAALGSLSASSRTLPLRNTVKVSNRGGLVMWTDVSSHLPSVEECEDLITFYFEELCNYIRISQRSAFEKQWRRLLDGTGIPQTEASLIFTALALADIMIPGASPIKRHSRSDHKRWMTLVSEPTSCPMGRAVDNSFSKIQLLGLTSIYHLYQGQADQLWECVGVAMRKGIVLGLFDERTKGWTELNNLEKEYRRRLAWYMLTLDRWQAFLRLLPFALHPSHVFLAEASFEPDAQVMRNNTPAKIVPNTPLCLADGRLENHISARKPGTVKFVFVEIVAWCQDYLDSFASMDPTTRYNQALYLDDALERVLVEGLHGTGIERRELHSLSTTILDDCPRERQVEINLWLSSLFFLRCIITRRFLMDDNAPPNLRFVSLVYAQGILATIPSLTRLMKEGRSPIQTTWNANHLLAAATTFTVVILGHDHYIESQTNPLEVNTLEPTIKGPFPDEQIKWLADNIFTTLECFETLSKAGNHAAAVAKQLLERLCTTQGDLRKLYRQRFNISAEEDVEQSSQQNTFHHRLHQQQPRQTRRGMREPSGNARRTELSGGLPSTMAQSSPSTASSSVDLGHIFAEPSLNNSFLLPMSASSLLDAVMMDPTELDFLGKSNHSDLLASMLQDSPQFQALPNIASNRLRWGRGAGLLSLLEGYSSYNVPSWARHIHPRRFAHDGHSNLDQRSIRGDDYDAPPARIRPTTRSHIKPPHTFRPTWEPVAVPDVEPQAVVSEENVASSSSTPSHVSPNVNNETPKQNVEQRSAAVVTKEAKRRPAAKTVLNGGLSHRERTQRKAQVRQIEETVGVREAQAAQKRFEREDALRKEKRKILVVKLRPYMEKQLRLIELEAEEQRKEVEARKSWTLEKLIKEGWALDGMEGFWLQKEKGKQGVRATSYSAVRTAVFHRQGKARLGWTKIQKGDQVELKKAEEGDGNLLNREIDSAPSNDTCIATVRSITENEIRLNFQAPFHDLDLIAHPLWRIEMAYNDLIEQRLTNGVEALLHDVEATHRAGAELSGTHLLEVLLEGSEEAKAKVQDKTMASWIDEHCQDSDEPDYGNLNTTQREAVQLMLSEPISLIQGPPGTGKTSTIVAAIRLLKQHYKVPHPILLTSHTNVAVDNLAQGCKDAGLRVIRAGAIVRVRESLNDVTVEGLMAKHPSKPRFDELEASKIATIKALQGIQASLDSNEEPEGTPQVSTLIDEAIDDDLEWLVGASLASEGNDLTRLQKRLSLLMQKSFVLRREMEMDIYGDVDVVCCTALSAPLLRVIDFPLVFFDEASMATEPITIATMIKGCQQLSLIGDQQQLSPLVKSREVIDEGLGLSLFERLMDRGDLPSVLLSTQHRMHPSLSDFPNREFYSGRLSDAPATSAIVPLHSSYIKPGKHLSFVDHTGREAVTKSKSLENNGEADLLIKIVADILCKNEDISGSDIGIITPYLGQKELLWKSLQDPTSYHRTLLANEVDRLGGSRSRLAEVNDIEIHTIDGFEGREKKVIIFSLVRANAFKYLGFLKEEKRWNVALTRAKNALVIVGNASMLERSKGGTEEIEEDSFLHRYADHLRSHDCIIQHS